MNPPFNPIGLILTAALCALAAALLYQQIGHGQDPLRELVRRTLPHSAMEQNRVTNAGPVDVADIAGKAGDKAATTPLSDYASITRRPLFAADRRPQELTPDQPVVASSALKVQLSGIVYSGDRATAILQPDQPGSRTIAVSKGEEYQGWVLTTIGRDFVTFQKDDQRQTFHLQFEKAGERAKPADRLRNGVSRGRSGGNPTIQPSSR